MITTAKTKATCSLLLSLYTPGQMALIIRHMSGIVCAPLSLKDAKRLRLDPMVAANNGAVFTVTVDGTHVLTTRILALIRSRRAILQ
jgi:3,4-dihydroxy 2-butanone 4-phosphate synthase/GTP cyclohydrolase II